MTFDMTEPSSLPALFADERGAVTVDWVVLSAAIIGLGLLVLNPIAVGTSSLASVVGGQVSGVSVGTGN